MSIDDEPAISYKVLRRGTAVFAADEAEVGTVRRVLDNPRENIFDGIVVSTAAGQRFVDAPEVRRITEHAVALSIDAAAVEALPPPASRIGEAFEMSGAVRRLRRAGRTLRERWDRR